MWARCARTHPLGRRNPPGNIGATLPLLGNVDGVRSPGFKLSDPSAGPAKAEAYRKLY